MNANKQIALGIRGALIAIALSAISLVAVYNFAIKELIWKSTNVLGLTHGHLLLVNWCFELWAVVAIASLLLLIWTFTQVNQRALRFSALFLIIVFIFFSAISSCIILAALRGELLDSIDTSYVG